jgi:peptidyl-prolyl cis-trans isomerase C
VSFPMRFLNTSLLFLAAGLVCIQTVMQAEPLLQDARPAVKVNSGKSYENIFPEVVARINGVPIAGLELARSIRGELEQIGSPDWESLREDYRGTLVYNSITGLINTKLIYDEAVASGTKVTDAEVQEEFLQIAKTFQNDKAMDEFLAAQNIDRDTMVKNIHKSMTVSKYIDGTVAKDVSVTPEQMAAYYKENPDAFRHPDIARTSHILIQTGADLKKNELAKQRIESLLARVEKGEDFAALAKEHSMSPSAAQGGDIGFVDREGLPPQYADAAFSLPIGGAKIVETEDGYFIVKVTDRKKEGLATLEEVKPALAEFLMNQKKQIELTKKINQLRDRAKIEILIPAGAPLNP